MQSGLNLNTANGLCVHDLLSWALSGDSVMGDICSDGQDFGVPNESSRQEVGL